MKKASAYVLVAYEIANHHWEKVLFSKFDVIRGVYVWFAVSENGPLKICLANEQSMEKNILRYIAMLEKNVLPLGGEYLFVQEYNNITQSNAVNSWFQNHQEIKCINWPTTMHDIAPIASAWLSMSTYVDRCLPLTLGEVKEAIHVHSIDLKKDQFETFMDSFW